MGLHPVISVVIATYNRQALLAQTLPTVLGQDLPPEQFEVIIVVDGSSDGTAAYLRTLKSACALTIIEQENRGAAAARKVAIGAARGDLILLLDDDILCPPHLLARHIEAHQANQHCVVLGAIHAAHASEPTLAAEWTRQLGITANHFLASSLVLPAHPLFADVDPNSSLAKSLYYAVGGYDENFATMLENADLALRLRAAGVQFLYLADAAVEHVYIKSTTAMARDDAWRYGYNLVLLCRKLPYFRPQQPLAIVGERGLLKHLCYYLSARMRALDVLVAAPLWLCERLMRWRPLRMLGIKLLLLRQRINFWHGAVAAAGSWQALKAAFACSLPVLMYHHVGPRRPGTYAELTVAPEDFAQQLQWLQRWGYTTISAAQWLQWRTGTGTLPAKPVLLSFDDAYADTAQYALPLLERFGFRGTTFVVTDEIGGTNSWDERIGSATHKLMSAEAIRHWAARGFEFGAHSLSHPSLPACNDEEARRQILHSKNALAVLTGQEVNSFAYPYGDFDDRIVALVREQFPLAVTTEAGINFLATDPCRLRRCMVMPKDGCIDLYGNLRWGFSPRHRLLEKLASLKHRLLRMAHR